jgi:hypothetical protein
MGGENHRVRISAAFDDILLCLRRLRRIETVAAVPFRIGDLDRVVHAVTGENGASVRLVQMEKGVPGRVSRREYNMDRIVYPVTVRDYHCLAGVDRRQDAIFEGFAPGVSCPFWPVAVFGFMKQILGVGKGGHPAPVHKLGVPANVVHMHITKSTDSGVAPIRVMSSRKGPSFICHGMVSGRFLWLPTQVSTKMVCRDVLMK